ncbi:MAG: hypothetical protein AAF532_04265 [Planctomycetota bacterium]
MRNIKDFKPFVPSNDYTASKAFYERLGFEISWDSGELCQIDTKFGYRFLLLPQNHDNYGASLMLHFWVDSARAWYDHCLDVRLTDEFPEAKVSPPELQPWGLIVTYVSDPAGVLLHFAEEPAEGTSA